MAETLLSPVIDTLTGLLVQEVKSLKRVRAEIKSLKDELDIIQPLLKDADAKSEKRDDSGAERAWVQQIRKEASRIEDVIDEYRHLAEQQKKPRNNGFIINSLCKACHFIKGLKPRHEIASEINSIKQSLSQIRGRAQAYVRRPSLEEGSTSKATDLEAENPRLKSLHIENDELVGIESRSRELVKNLVEGPSTRSVISLVGEGGLGKTTLMKKVYDDVVKRHFDSAHAWITVSQSYNLKKLLKNMRTKICKTGDNILAELDTVEELTEYLREYLKTKRYAIIFDDVWQENFWEQIKVALPENDQGSRIVITTRNITVANSSKKTTYDVIHNLEPWSQTLAWELFCKKAFRGEFQGNCPEELKQLSAEIISKCEGLPLAIAAIASLLSTKGMVESEWRTVLDGLSSDVERKYNDLTATQKILSLSYYDLPSHLKPCFLYFGVFLEDYSISDERLYRLWIAEGFVKAEGHKTLEEVAKVYLNELILRNLVVVDSLESIGEGTLYRVHDLMRDVILSRADEVGFCQIWDEKKSKTRGNGRCLTISTSTENVLKNVETTGVRSILLFDIEDQLTKSFMVTLSKKFRYLKVLDFENALIDALPKELGNLFCLKYLSLRYTNVRVLPKSIGNLYNLQSLDIRDTLIDKIPIEINKLKNLRHLLAYRYNSSAEVHGVLMQEGFGQLEELQTLTLVEAHQSAVGLMKELEKLRKLRWLGITKMTREFGRALCACIANMDHLERLFVNSIDENEVLDLQYIPSNSLHFLRDLLLGGRLEKLPEWIQNLRNLQGLSLCYSRLSDNELSKCFQGLPNLVSIELIDQAYEGEQLQFEEGGFRKLKRLTLKRLDRLKLVKIDKGALPVLELLRIANCLLLNEMPSIHHLGSIKHVFVNGQRLH